VSPPTLRPADDSDQGALPFSDALLARTLRSPSGSLRWVGLLH